MDYLSGLGATQVKYYGWREPSVEAGCVSAAHRRGLPVLSHFLRPASVDAGLDRKEHVYYYGLDGNIRSRFGRDTIETPRRADITISSTLLSAFAQSAEGRARFKAALPRADVAGFLPPSRAGFLRSSMDEPSTQAAHWDRSLDAIMTNAAAADAAGIRIVAGTDYPFLASGLHWELELLVKAGFFPLDALRTATGTAAAILWLRGQLGCISPGAIADLVVLEANPLEDIRNTQEIHAKGAGFWVVSGVRDDVADGVLVCCRVVEGCEWLKRWFTGRECGGAPVEMGDTPAVWLKRWFA